MKKLLLIATLIMSLPTFADEVEESVEQAMDLYKKGQAQQAITQLEYAAQLIRQQRGEGLKGFLPAALSGWKAEDAESQTAGAAMFGGGTSVSREYSKGDSSISISIVTDSPLLQSVMMMLSNPMMFQSQGAKLKMIKGQQVMLNKDGAMAVVNNTYLVQIDMGSGTEEDVLAYAKEIDYAGIGSYK